MLESIEIVEEIFQGETNFHIMEQNKTSGARSLEKAFDLLFSFQARAPEQSLSQISRQLRFPPSTARRLLKVLMSRRLIQQNRMTKLYRLGPGILYLASLAKEGSDIRKIALPVMERLRDATRENTALHELREGKRVCIEKVESKQVLRDTILIGDQFPAHAGATGKVLLAHLPKEELAKYLDSKPLQSLTPRTINDPKKLVAELARIRKRGVAFSCGERVMDGLCAVSAPIFDSEEQVHYCLTVTLTPFRLQAAGRDKLFAAVKNAAREISIKYGALAGRSRGAFQVLKETAPDSRRDAYKQRMSL
jgi:DNA-binding IclR family transcriptional regulator